MSEPGGIGHNSKARRADDVQRRYETNVIAISTWVGKRRIEEALSRQKLGSLTGLDRLVALRNATLDGLHHYYMTNPQADVGPGVFALICLMSDNSHGCCSVSVSRMAQLLNRDRRNVGKAIKRLEQDGCISVDRQRSRDGDGNVRAAGKEPLAWPIINPIYAEHRDPITWALDAHAPNSRRIKRAIQASQVDEPAIQPSQVSTCDTAIHDLRYSHRTILLMILLKNLRGVFALRSFHPIGCCRLSGLSGQGLTSSYRTSGFELKRRHSEITGTARASPGRIGRQPGAIGSVRTGRS